MELSFKAPQYTKTTNAKTGIQEPCYTFNIEIKSEEDLLSFIAYSDTDISLQELQKTILDNISWWNSFIGKFLESSTKFFSKPYTVENINKIAKHTLNGTKSDKYPVNITLIPKNIQICGGNFIINWGYTIQSVVIDIPDLTDNETHNIEINSVPAQNKIIDDMEELTIDNLPVQDESTGEVLSLDSPSKLYDKQLVKEARLKARLAIYKAQRQMAKYMEKYGDDVSDSDDEYDSSDEEESGEEEVQL
jgi:hypothetical protein